VTGIVVAVNGGKIAAHRALVTRLVSIRGAPAVAIGLVMVVVGVAALVVAWTRGLAWT
jgi:hypothetical protein